MAALPDGRVSTIIPVFNRPSMLAEAVRTVLAQTYRPIEIIIVDDGSTDGTADVISRLTREHREIKSLHQRNGGPGAAREIGRQLAAGEFIQYLDSDDLLLPRKFELQVEALRQHPECGVAYGKTLYTDSAGNEIECTWKRPNDRRASMWPSFIETRWWETATPLYRRSVTDRVGAWTSLRLEEDWEYDCRIAASGAQLAFVDEFVAVHRDHDRGRLSAGDSLDPARLISRAKAHELIAGHVRRVPGSTEVPEVQHFARELFLLSRQCGAGGLVEEARRLHSLAVELASDPRLRRRLRLYASAAELLGWTVAGRASGFVDRFRR